MRFFIIVVCFLFCCSTIKRNEIELKSVKLNFEKDVHSFCFNATDSVLTYSKPFVGNYVFKYNFITREIDSFKISEREWDVVALNSKEKNKILCYDICEKNTCKAVLFIYELIDGSVLLVDSLVLKAFPRQVFFDQFRYAEEELRVIDYYNSVVTKFDLVGDEIIRKANVVFIDSDIMTSWRLSSGILEVFDAKTKNVVMRSKAPKGADDSSKYFIFYVSGNYFLVEIKSDKVILYDVKTLSEIGYYDSSLLNWYFDEISRKVYILTDNELISFGIGT